MLRLSALLFLALLPALAESPFAGRWNFNIVTPRGPRAAWLGIKDQAGTLTIWYQPTGGNVFEIKGAKLDGGRLTLPVSRDTTWELEASAGKLVGAQKRGETTIALEGTPAPALNRPAPKKWSKPEPLFNGRDLAGWEPMTKDTHWTVKDGLLVNEDHGANLRSTRAFDDFKLHFEVNCPDHANSGFYLRGRYEVQIESEPLSANPPERRIGSIYGRIAPRTELPRTPGAWDVFDVTLIGRTVTVVRNGVLTIDRQEIEGITGGALDANEALPGPFYIQGDHTGGLKFRNITISVPAR